MIELIRPGGDGSNPTVSVTYHDTVVPSWTEAQQRISGTTYMKVRKFYDGLGRLAQNQTAAAALDVGTRDSVVNYWYDAYGNLIEQSVPYAVTTGSGYRTPDLGQASTLTSYDTLGRLLQTTASDGITHPATYTYLDLETQVMDANGHTTRNHYDIWGRTTEVDPPAGPSVTYIYDESDRLTQATRGGATTAIGYDLAGRKVTLNDPDLGAWSYAYNGVGNLTQQTDARGCKITLGYDALDRLLSKSYGLLGCVGIGTIGYTYDAYDPPNGQYGRGYRSGMTDGSGSTAWKYDARGRVSEETKTVTGSGTFMTQWGYNSADLVAWMKYPADNLGNVGEQLFYAYHAQGWLNTAINYSGYNYVQGTS